jgi:hypothetical protein
MRIRTVSFELAMAALLGGAVAIVGYMAERTGATGWDVGAAPRDSASQQVKDTGQSTDGDFGAETPCPGTPDFVCQTCREGPISERGIRCRV